MGIAIGTRALKCKTLGAGTVYHIELTTGTVHGKPIVFIFKLYLMYLHAATYTVDTLSLIGHTKYCDNVIISYHTMKVCNTRAFTNVHAATSLMIVYWSIELLSCSIASKVFVMCKTLYIICSCLCPVSNFFK